MHVQFTNDDASGAAKFANDGSILSCDPIPEICRTIGGGHVANGKVIFHANRNSIQRTQQRAVSPSGITLSRGNQGCFIIARNENTGVSVFRRYPPEYVLHDRFRSCPAGRKCVRERFQVHSFAHAGTLRLSIRLIGFCRSSICVLSARDDGATSSTWISTPSFAFSNARYGVTS